MKTLRFLVPFGVVAMMCLFGATAQSPLPKYQIRTLTSGPKHHFFGYYGIPPWNQSGKYLVCLESDFQDHLPQPNEAAAVGLVDAKTGEFKKVGETRAWNLQQGAMLYWNPLDPENEVIFNDRRADQPGKIISVALNVKTGKKRDLPLGISAVSHSGRHALSLDYGRLYRLRPVVGYVGAVDPNPQDAHPANDGAFLIDLKTGKYKLVVSYQTIYQRLIKDHPAMAGMLKERHMFFNHTVFNKDDTRFFFLARIFTPEPDSRLESAMFTCNLDGSDLREVVPFGKGVSHFEWRNSKEILATFRFNGDEIKHVLFTDGAQNYQAIGEGFLKNDGHCSFAPDGQWIVTDRNLTSTREKMLMIFHTGMKQGLVLGSFPVKEYLSGDLRCDLHPRWSRSGDAICFDTLEAKTWTRQLHVAYLDFK